MKGDTIDVILFDGKESWRETIEATKVGGTVKVEDDGTGPMVKVVESVKSGRTIRTLTAVRSAVVAIIERPRS